MDLTHEEMEEMFRQARTAGKVHTENFVPLPDFTPPPQPMIGYVRPVREEPATSALTSIFMEGFDPNNKAESVTTDDTMFAEMDECKHTELTETESGDVCVKCAKVIGFKSELVPEWRYYGSADSRFSKDPTRVSSNPQRQYRSISDIDILPDGFDDEVLHKANSIYRMMTVSKPFRGKSLRHRSALFACIYGAHQQLGRPLPPEIVNKAFKLKRGDISKGVKEYMHVMRERKVELPCVSMPDIVIPILKHIYGPEDRPWYPHVQELAHRVWNLNYEMFHRSSPQSVAAGLLYWYIATYKPHDITVPSRSAFAKCANLSDITITKFTKEVNIIIQVMEWNARDFDYRT